MFGTLNGLGRAELTILAYGLTSSGSSPALKLPLRWSRHAKFVLPNLTVQLQSACRKAQDQASAQQQPQMHSVAMSSSPRSSIDGSLRSLLPASACTPVAIAATRHPRLGCIGASLSGPPLEDIAVLSLGAHTQPFSMTAASPCHMRGHGRAWQTLKALQVLRLKK